MQQIVINKCYGGFSVSRAAFLRLRELGSEVAKSEPDAGEMYSDGSGPRDSCQNSFCYDIKRDDPLLVRVVQELKEAANGECAQLAIVEVPDGVEWDVKDYDGFEHVAEAHRTWG